MTQHKQLVRMSLAAILLALTVVFGRIFLIPLPWTHGNVNLCDAGIFIASLMLGPWYGGFVGGFGGLFLDLISGFAQYAPFSFVAHGLEGLITGLITKHLSSLWGKILGLTVGTIIMVVLYLVSDSIMYSFSTGILGIGPNLFQGLIGAVVAFVIEKPLQKRIKML